MSGPKHSCGVVGIAADSDVANALYTALMIIQHRGQESAGISVYDGAAIETVKGDGLRLVPGVVTRYGPALVARNKSKCQKWQQ